MFAAADAPSTLTSVSGSTPFVLMLRGSGVSVSFLSPSSLAASSTSSPKSGEARVLSFPIKASGPPRPAPTRPSRAASLRLTSRPLSVANVPPTCSIRPCPVSVNPSCAAPFINLRAGPPPILSKPFKAKELIAPLATAANPAPFRSSMLGSVLLLFRALS